MKTEKVEKWYEKNQSTLFYIPLILLVFALAFLVINSIVTGDLVQRDISLSGGIVVTIDVSTYDDVSLSALKSKLDSEFRDAQFDLSEVTSQSQQTGIVIESNLESAEDRQLLVDYISTQLGVNENQLTVEQTQSAFGQAFFVNLLIGVVISFVLMGFVVFFTFKKWYPSVLVIFAVFSDIIITLAIVTLLGVKLSAAGIAAFLMIIGYAVDTNILLSFRLLRSHDDEPIKRVTRAAKTGLLMSLTTFAAMLTALFVTNSDIIFQILLILTIALFVDVLNTWFFNAKLLMGFVKKLEKHQKHGGKKKK